MINNMMMQGAMSDPRLYETEKSLAKELLGLTEDPQRSSILSEYDSTMESAQTADDESRIIRELMKEYRNEI